jgi:hypothetical protein
LLALETSSTYHCVEKAELQPTGYKARRLRGANASFSAQRSRAFKGGVSSFLVLLIIAGAFKRGEASLFMSSPPLSFQERGIKGVRSSMDNLIAEKESA